METLLQGTGHRPAGRADPGGPGRGRHANDADADGPIQSRRCAGEGVRAFRRGRAGPLLPGGRRHHGGRVQHPQDRRLEDSGRRGGAGGFLQDGSHHGMGLPARRGDDVVPASGRPHAHRAVGRAHGAHSAGTPRRGRRVLGKRGLVPAALRRRRIEGHRREAGGPGHRLAGQGRTQGRPGALRRAPRTRPTCSRRWRRFPPTCWTTHGDRPTRGGCFRWRGS